MFCIKCGCHISAKAEKCLECGADLPSMEYCSGFWSELNQNHEAMGDDGREVKQVECIENKRSDALKRRITSERGSGQKDKASKWQYLLIAEGVVILIVLLFGIISGSRLRRQISELNNQNAKLEEEKGALQIEYEKLEREKAALEEKYKYIEEGNNSRQEEETDSGIKEEHVFIPEKPADEGRSN